jgi:hypothetical protein
MTNNDSSFDVNKKVEESCPPRKILKSDEFNHETKEQYSMESNSNDNLILDMKKKRKLCPYRQTWECDPFDN